MIYYPEKIHVPIDLPTYAFHFSKNTLWSFYGRVAVYSVLFALKFSKAPAQIPL